MSEKHCDRHGRWRNRVIAFRVSEEENQSIDMRVRLSGLTKQEYLARCSQQQTIVVNGNPRVYKALKERLEQVYEELKRISDGSEISVLLEETIVVIAKTLDGLSADEGKSFEKADGEQKCTICQQKVVEKEIPADDSKTGGKNV